MKMVCVIIVLSMISLLTCFGMNPSIVASEDKQDEKNNKKKCKYRKILFNNLCVRFKESIHEPFKDNSTQEVILISCAKNLPVILAALVVTNFNTKEETINYYEIDLNNEVDEIYLYHWFYDSKKRNPAIKNLITNVKKNVQKMALLCKYSDKNSIESDFFDYTSYPKTFINKSYALKNIIESFRNHAVLHYKMISRKQKNK